MALKLKKNVFNARVLGYFIVFVALFGTVFVLGFRVSALSDELLDRYARNNIMFYNPDECTQGSQIVSNGIYSGKRFSLSDDELKRLWWGAKAEQDTTNGIKTELSIFANKYDDYNGKIKGKEYGLVDFVAYNYDKNCRSCGGWFAKTTGEAIRTGQVEEWDEKYSEPTSEEINIARDILNNGNRTVPKEVNEHDCFGDIKSLELDGTKHEFDKTGKTGSCEEYSGAGKDMSLYVSGKTIIRNNSGATYTFYMWANGEKTCESGNCGDPFGYEGSAPQSSGQAASSINSAVEVSNTGIVLREPTYAWLKDNSAYSDLNITNDKAVDSGKKIDSSVMTGSVGNMNYKNYAADAGGGAGLPGFIVLHWTTGHDFEAGNLGGYYPCGRGSACPPHFTIDVVNKKIWQHFPLNHPSAAVASGSGITWDLYGVQIEVVGYGKGDNHGLDCDGSGKECSTEGNYYIGNWGDEEWNFLAKLLMAINQETGIPLQSDLDWSDHDDNNNSICLNKDQMLSYFGVMGHIHVNGDNGKEQTNCHNKNDPYDMWGHVKPALERLGYKYNTVKSTDLCLSGTSSGTGTCFYPEESKDGGCTKDGYTYYWQAGASWSDTVTEDGCQMSGTGCGFAATAMILTAFLGQKITPPDVSKAAISWADSVDDGSCNGRWSIAKNAIEGFKYGNIINYTFHDGTILKLEVANEILDKGGMIFVSVGSSSVKWKDDIGSEYQNGILTTGGHFIVIRKKIDNNTWQIFSSSKKPNKDVNNLYFDADSILSAMRSHYTEVYAK